MKRAALCYRQFRLALVLAVITLCGVAGIYHGDFVCALCLDEHPAALQAEVRAEGQSTSSADCCMETLSQNACRNCCVSNDSKPFASTRVFSFSHGVFHLPPAPRFSPPLQIAVLIDNTAAPIRLTSTLRSRCPSRAPPVL